MVKAVILAAGLGTRMRPYTLFVPKVMLPLGEKPVLEHIIDWLQTYDIKDIVICVGYLRKVIEDYFGTGDDFGVNIEYVRTKKPLGTGGQLKSASHLVDDTFLCIYGDSVIDFNINDFLSFHSQNKSLVTIALKNHEIISKYGFIDTDKTGKVTSWREKPKFGGLINIGCYAVEPSFLDYIPPGVMFGMDEAITRSLDSNESINAQKIDGEFIDLGDRKSYVQAHEKYLGKLGNIA